ncbi:MAG: hypothetical protein DMG53_24500 [Acidobacteria bacterium]|nr:MAG: hypothetical protein DMG53_24500 [Acidobacteriota bacterium]
MARVSSNQRLFRGISKTGDAMGPRWASPPSKEVTKPALPVNNGTGFTSSLCGDWASDRKAKKVDNVRARTILQA